MQTLRLQLDRIFGHYAILRHGGASLPDYIGMAPEMPRAGVLSSSEMDLDIDKFEIVDVATQ